MGGSAGSSGGSGGWPLACAFGPAEDLRLWRLLGAVSAVLGGSLGRLGAVPAAALAAMAGSWPPGFQVRHTFREVPTAQKCCKKSYEIKIFFVRDENMTKKDTHAPDANHDKGLAKTIEKG